jgi:hypothetical protein
MLADKGKSVSIFFADGCGPHQTYQEKPDATYAGGSMAAYMNPAVVVSAMAAVTKSVAFGITGSTSYIRKLDLGLPFQISAIGLRCSSSVGSDRIDKRTIDNRANLSIIDNRLSIIIIIELGGKGPGRIYPSYSLF